MAAIPASAANVLKAEHVGKTLHEVSTPSIVLDLAKLEVNCERMLQATDKLGLQWRAHIKTHKTIELTRLQVGDERTTCARIIVSTITEAENIIPLLKEYQSRGRDVSLLYAFPLFSSAIPRLAAASRQLGPGAFSAMVDHADQVPLLAKLRAAAGHPPLVFVKVDTGYGRAGAPPGSASYARLVTELLGAEQRGEAVIQGLYSHAGHSYDSRTNWAAMQLLLDEFKELHHPALEISRARQQLQQQQQLQQSRLVLSVGATPTTTTIQHPLLGGSSGSSPTEASLVEGGNPPPTEALADLVKELRSADLGLELEVHAGVYPTLDLQQLATHARDAALLSVADLAVSVVAEVASVYPGRGQGQTTEALVSAGSLALGREPVKDTTGGAETNTNGNVPYTGWGWVMPWGGAAGNPVPGPEFPLLSAARSGGWQVGRISQEHGILTWLGRREDEVKLQVGQRVRIWPNHSCIAGSGYDYYLVVDSRRQGKEDEIVDVWPRWHGW